MVRGRLRLLASALLLGVCIVIVDAQVPQSVLNRDAHLAQLAAEAAARGPATGIPLLGDSGRIAGAVYDQYFLGVVIARQLIASNQPADDKTIAAHVLFRGHTTVVIAFPIDCDGKADHPLAIRWTTSASVPVAPQLVGEAVRGNAAESILPGVGLPDDALVVNLRNALPVGASVEVDYANPVCHGAARTAKMPVAVSPSLGASTGFNGVKLPDASLSLPSPAILRFSAMLDSTGHVRFPELVEGPKELESAALDLLNTRTFSPAKTNGVPTPLSMIVPVVFTTTGVPAAIPPYNPAQRSGGAPSASGGPGVLTMTRGTMVAVPVTSSVPPPVIPPAPPGELEAHLSALAIEVAKASEPTPVPLDAAGPPVHGVLFDRFLMAVVKLRAASVSGTPRDPAAVTSEIVQEGLTAVAYPLECGNRKVMPDDIVVNVGGTRPGPLRQTSGVLRDADVTNRLPGVMLPVGAIGKSFVNAFFSSNVEVAVSYGSAVCSGDQKAATLPIQWQRGGSIGRLPTAKLPDGTTLPSPVAVQMRGLVDLAGAYRFPGIADGPAELAPTAVLTATAWKFNPYRANGVPVPQSVTAQLTFTTTGAPEPIVPPNAAPPPTSSAPPDVLTSTTIAGRPSDEMTTADVPGLTSRTSQCAVATTSTYGFSPAVAIKVGGGAVGGPARERRYLGVLRGPTGQGIHLFRRGSTLAPDGQTILDLYELTYDGLATPLRLFLDEYHEGTLEAPQGLVCAAPIVR